ncbi:1,3-beta-D-glucan synthase [Ceratobasidium sp. 428]|nr:1,3-beta-D-glucan synthase [Ceratobasidium sp. 428]
MRGYRMPPGFDHTRAECRSPIFCAHHVLLTGSRAAPRPETHHPDTARAFDGYLSLSAANAGEEVPVKPVRRGNVESANETSKVAWKLKFEMYTTHHPSPVLPYDALGLFVAYPNTRLPLPATLPASPSACGFRGSAPSPERNLRCAGARPHPTCPVLRPRLGYGPHVRASRLPTAGTPTPSPRLSGNILNNSPNDSLNQQRDAAASEVSTPTFNDYTLGALRKPYPTRALNVRSPYPRKKSRTFSSTLLKNSAFGATRCETRFVNMSLFSCLAFDRGLWIPGANVPYRQFDLLMQLLDSRASRMSPEQALTTLHADYIGGPHANYRKWYSAAQLDLDDAVGQTQYPGVKRLQSVRRPGGAARPATGAARSLESAINRWRQAMHKMSQYDRLRQLALYLLCSGEAAQVRFVPECLCFIFKCADDYYRVIKPLYRFIRDQGYEVQDGKFVRREKDHEDIIGYDDVNQLFLVSQRHRANSP